MESGYLFHSVLFCSWIWKFLRFVMAIIYFSSRVLVLVLVLILVLNGYDELLLRKAGRVRS